MFNINLYISVNNTSIVTLYNSFYNLLEEATSYRLFETDFLSDIVKQVFGLVWAFHDDDATIYTFIIIQQFNHTRNVGQSL